MIYPQTYCSSRKVANAKTGSDDSDLIGLITSQLTPFIRNTISTSLSLGAPAPTQKPAPVCRVVPARPAPIVRVVNVEEQVASIFGTGGTNNVKVKTLDFNFAFNQRFLAGWFITVPLKK